MSLFGRKEKALYENLLKATEEREKEFIELKQKCAEYENRLNNANLENGKLREYRESDLDPFRKRIVSDKKLAKSVYSRKYEFTSRCETLLYRWLCDVAKSDSLHKYELMVFSQVRLADVVVVREESIEDFRKNINYIKNGKSLVNHSKENVYREMEASQFDDKKFTRTFLYPLFRSHIDFLICCPSYSDKRPPNETLTPLVAIELFGKEHFDFDWKNRTLQRNDEFKRHLFEAVGIVFDNTFTNKAIEEAFEDKEKERLHKKELEGLILKAIRKNE